MYDKPFTFLVAVTRLHCALALAKKVRKPMIKIKFGKNIYIYIYNSMMYLSGAKSFIC